MTREQARELINSEPDRALMLLTKSKGGQYICPSCKSGTGKNGTGALSYYPKSKRFCCHACQEGEGLGKPGQDVLGTLCIIYECNENGVFEREGLTIDTYSHQGTPGKHTAATTNKGDTMAPQEPEAAKMDAQELTEPQDLRAYFKECKDRLQNSQEAISYLQARGISTETAAAYWIGYDPKSDPAGAGHPTPRIIMPTCKSHYVARRIDGGEDYKKMNNRATPAIFNAKALHNNSIETVFVVEGIFDALSIIEAGGQAIALNSTTQAQKFIDQLTEQRTAATLILCLDNDDAGKKATNKIKEGLQRLNISYVTADICGAYKDPNEHLQADKKAFTEAINEAIRTTAARPDNVTDYIDTLMSGEIEQFREARNRRTGFNNLDEQAKGLYSGLYVVAAISSLGKTTFCHQIADQLAAMGEDVLFFSLEQSRLELVSKSLARRTAQKDAAKAVNSLSIRRGYLPEQVLKAAAEYKSDIAERLSVIEGNFACNFSFIGEYIRKYIAKTGKKPVVFIDYLQILQPEQDQNGRTQSTKETVDTTVTELKRISREMGLTVFVISSVNRANYLTPIDFESLKESGGIEYTADVIWGLQLQALNDPIFDKKDKIKQKRQILKEAKAATPRKIELVCLKNRYGVSSYSAYFNYFPEFDLFTEGVNEYQETEKPPETAKKRI